MSHESLQRLEELASADPALVGTLIDMFFEQAPSLAADIQSQVDANDADACCKAAHTLKGVCLNMGFNDMAELCKGMESKAKNGDLDTVRTLLKDYALALQAFVPVLKDYKAKKAEEAAA